MPAEGGGGTVSAHRSSYGPGETVIFPAAPLRRTSAEQTRLARLRYFNVTSFSTNSE